MYTFKNNIERNEFDTFVKNFPDTIFMQTSAWAEVKKDAWQSDLVGLYEDDKLVATAMILKRSMPLGRKLFYIPRGFVIDYTNKDLLKIFTDEIRKYAKKDKAFAIKIDPFICFDQDNIQNIKKNKGIAVNKRFCENADLIFENIKAVGFQHGGFRKDVNAYVQPRFTMVIPMHDPTGKLYDESSLKKTFPKNVRNYIGKYHSDRGVRFYTSRNPDDVNKLVSVLQYTEAKQHIQLRNEEYFRTVMNAFPDNAVLFFVEIDINAYIEFLHKDTADHPEKAETNEKRLQEAYETKKEYGDTPLSGATIVMLPTNTNGIKTAEFLYAGTNEKIFPSLHISNGLMMFRLMYCLEEGCDYCDLGGIDGDLNDHLSTFKSKFNPEVLELIGEFDLIISPFWYHSFNIAKEMLTKYRYYQETKKNK